MHEGGIRQENIIMVWKNWMHWSRLVVRWHVSSLNNKLHSVIKEIKSGRLFFKDFKNKLLVAEMNYFLSTLSQMPPWDLNPVSTFPVLLSNTSTGGQTSQIITSTLEKTVWWWSGMRTASGMTCPATTTCHSPARKALVSSDSTSADHRFTGFLLRRGCSAIRSTS